jgi:hypothetical protein
VKHKLEGFLKASLELSGEPPNQTLPADGGRAAGFWEFDVAQRGRRC